MSIMTPMSHHMRKILNFLLKTFQKNISLMMNMSMKTTLLKTYLMKGKLMKVNITMTVNS